MALKGKTKNIGYSVAYNNAVALIAGGVVELDTEDIGAEIADLADVLYEHLEQRLDQEAAPGGRGKAGGGTTRSSGRSSGSKGRGSTRRGSSGGGKPSGKQLAYLIDLARDRDHGYDIEEDGDDVLSIDGKDLSDMTRNDVSSLIEELREAPEL